MPIRKPGQHMLARSGKGWAFWIKKGDDHPELEPTGTSLFVSLRDPKRNI